MAIKPNVSRWLDLEVGDSIIERATPSLLRALAKRLEKSEGMHFTVEPMEPVPRPVLITRVLDPSKVEE